jgi:hypothetical protein
VIFIEVESAFVDYRDWRTGDNKLFLSRYFTGDPYPTLPSDEPAIDTALEVSIWCKLFSRRSCFILTPLGFKCGKYKSTFLPLPFLGDYCELIKV